MLSPLKKRSLDDSTQFDTHAPTRHELWRWCLRTDAVAQCYVRDIMALREADRHDSKEHDMWWLGTVPCRSVRFVGMLVGARAYERRTMYTVDDGTGVIQCVQPLSPAQLKHKVPPSKSAPSSPQADFPQPKYEVGDILRVTGRVENWNDTRQIIVQDVGLCRPNDEPAHWLATAALHEAYYIQPFVIPPLPPPPIPRTPVKPSTATASTPSTASTVPTPSTTASASSPSKAEGVPTRLRHPARLRSRELIASTFKIYLKNYMDVLSDPGRRISSRASSFVQESPTKRVKRIHNGDTTPRPREKSVRVWNDTDATPRAHGQGATARANDALKGFTLSYLRRVPELADMARRVVEAEGKRRAREARHAQREAARAGKASSASAPAASTSKKAAAPPPPQEPPGRKAKRLYTWALRELCREGSIILHEDGASVWEQPAGANVWKPSTSLAETASANDDDDALSDAPPHEESYVPLTLAMLLDPILDAIPRMMRRKPNASTKTKYSHKAAGPTTDELRAYLGSLDARWEHVGAYAVADALEVLRCEEKVYRVGLGRWEIVR